MSGFWTFYLTAKQIQVASGGNSPTKEKRNYHFIISKFAQLEINKFIPLIFFQFQGFSLVFVFPHWLSSISLNWSNSWPNTLWNLFAQSSNIQELNVRFPFQARPVTENCFHFKSSNFTNLRKLCLTMSMATWKYTNTGSRQGCFF